MPKFTNSEFNKIISACGKPNGDNTIKHPLTGAELYDGISDEPFDSLSAEEKFIYNLFAEAANEVLAEYEENRF